ncbi:CopD family protein [Trinickia caryophylli]|nr:hypothetical protein C0Z17_10175 [Trinickia caryophylli]TRX20158.1 hypothetical protein FNF07_01345 [Trinickia caryophylli]GLU31601.1 hypothetical protein Busp01_14430 [Trinickia caryophylli]
MIYLLVKVVHISSVMTFVGGLLALSVGIRVQSLPLQRALGRWDRNVTSPALGLVWATGIAMVVLGHWFGDVWLTIKFLLVTALSALHGILSGKLRRIEHDGTGAVPPAWAGKTGLPIIAAIAAIVALVVFKHV